MTTCEAHWHIEEIEPEVFCAVDEQGRRSRKHFFFKPAAQTYIDQYNCLKI